MGEAVLEAIRPLRGEGVVRGRPRREGGAAHAPRTCKGEARRRVRRQLLDVSLQLHVLILLELGGEGVLEAARYPNAGLGGAGRKRTAVRAAVQPLLQPEPRALKVTGGRRRSCKPQAEPPAAGCEGPRCKDAPEAHRPAEACGRLDKAGTKGNGGEPRAPAQPEAAAPHREAEPARGDALRRRAVILREHARAAAGSGGAQQLPINGDGGAGGEARGKVLQPVVKARRTREAQDRP